MPVSKEEVRQIAHLARLRLSPAEESKYAEELSSILDFFQKLQEVDTSDATESQIHTRDRTPLRPDEVQPSLPIEKALSNAPDTDGRFFRVPRVIG